MNIVVLQGTPARPPEERVLRDGVRVVEIELSVAGPEGRAEVVPVTWPDPPASAVAALVVDRPVVVVGRVRRRFFRAGGQTQSRTEVVAESLLSARSTKRVRAALDEAASQLSL